MNHQIITKKLTGIRESFIDAGEDFLAKREAIGSFEVVVIWKRAHHAAVLCVEKVFGDTAVKDLAR